MEKYLPILRSCPFFMGLNDTEILSILHCVNAVKVSKASRSYIFKAGDSTEVMGLVLAGSTLIIQEDLWGHRNILSKCNAGDFFGEPYAATPGTILNISVVAEEDCDILFLNINRLLTSCPTACDHHQKLIRNFIQMHVIPEQNSQKTGCRDTEDIINDQGRPAVKQLIIKMLFCLVLFILHYRLLFSFS